MDNETFLNKNAIGRLAGRSLYTRQPGSAMRCGGCGAAQIALLPTFSTGKGTGFRTLIDDIYCLRCGRIGQPGFASDGGSEQVGTDEGSHKNGK